MSMSSHTAYQIEGSFTTNVKDNIVNGLSFETHDSTLKEAVEIDWPAPGHGEILQVACWSNSLAWAEFCIRHGANVNTFSPRSGEIPLAMAARLAFVEMVNLLQHGASIHGSGAVVMTP